jgi:hypothetical protein
MTPPMTDPRGELIAPAAGWGRVVRGSVLGTACVALSLGWHAAGGGTLPGTGALLLLAFLASAAGTCWAGRRRGPGALLLATVAGQVAVHGLAQLLTGHPAGLLPESAGMLAAHAAAAAGVAWLLARGEDLVWELCAALVHAWAPLPAPALPVACPAGASLAHLWPDVPPRGLVLVRERPRRGPPTARFA